MGGVANGGRHHGSSGERPDAGSNDEPYFRVVVGEPVPATLPGGDGLMLPIRNWTPSGGGGGAVSCGIPSLIPEPPQPPTLRDSATNAADKPRVMNRLILKSPWSMITPAREAVGLPRLTGPGSSAGTPNPGSYHQDQ
jgi:hypothetical protein